MKFLYPLLLLTVILFSCKKDCLEKDKCKLSTHASPYLIEANAPNTTGSIYYVDFEAGDDGNDGLSEASAFQTLDKVSELALVEGDQVLFKRGQVHSGYLDITANGSASENIYFSDYGTGHLPVIKSYDSKPSSTEPTIWLIESTYITFQNLDLQGGSYAIDLSNSSYITFTGCRIGERSHGGIRATQQYSDGNGSNYGHVYNCLIYSGLSGDLGDGQSTDGIALQDGASNWHVHHNEIKAWAHSGVSIKQLATLNENNNNIIEYNLFECRDIDYMRAIDISGGDHLCENNQFNYNIVRNQSVTSHLHGNSNVASYNLFLGLTESDATEQPWAFDFYCIINRSGNPGRNELVCYDNLIANNLIYNYTSGDGVRVLKSKEDATYKVHDNSVVNNIFYNVETAIEMDKEPTNTTFSHNIIFNTSGQGNYVYDYQNQSFSQFEALSGTDGHVIGNNLVLDPLFLNIGAEDFRLTSGSPAINTGIDVGLFFDYTGTPITAAPDIGPYEY